MSKRDVLHSVRRRLDLRIYIIQGMFKREVMIGWFDRKWQQGTRTPKPFTDKIQSYTICQGSLLLRWFNFKPSWISNYIHYKVWDEITYPFLNFNGATVEV